MTIAIAGAVGWLMIIAAGLRFGAAAKRGDEIAEAVQRNRELRQGYGRVIPLDRARNAQRSTHAGDPVWSEYVG